MGTSYKKFTKQAGPLPADAITERMSLPVKDDARITITPLLDEHQIGEGSIDLRLGNEFIIPTKVSWDAVTQESGSNANSRWGRHHLEGWITPNEPLMLHPGQLVLASTLEFVAIPLDVSAQVDSKSSWGRMGIVVATAAIVHPGFRGILTLELLNTGEIPIVLHLGTPIAQLWLVGMSQAGKRYDGQFKCPVGPEVPDIQKLYSTVPKFKF